MLRRGRVRERKPLTVKIPAGVNSGARIRLSGQGEAGTAGGPNGDLYVELRINPDPTFMREGDDLHARVGISMAAAALGTTISLDTFDGVQKLDIKAGVQSGDVLTLKELGVQHLRKSGRGDLHVHIEVRTPTDLSREEKELLKKFAELRQEDLEQSETISEKQGFFSRIKDRFDK